MGKSACAVALECKAAGQEEGLQDIGHKIAMHITAMKPRFLDRNSVPAEVLEKERDILKEQARMSGKPEHIIESCVLLIPAASLVHIVPTPGVIWKHGGVRPLLQR